MRTRLYTRALLAVAAVLLLAGFRSSSLTIEERIAPAVPATATAPAPADVALPALPDDHLARPEVSRSDVQAPTTPLIWPAPGQITGPFGDGRHHPGIDIDGVTGDPADAAAPGTVVQAGAAPADYSGYGNLVVIDHGGGVSTLYAHLSRVDVTVGQVVQQGQTIGAIGNTGASTGDHLHFEFRILNKPVDPMAYLPPRS